MPGRRRGARGFGVEEELIGKVCPSASDRAMARPLQRLHRVLHVSHARATLVVVSVWNLDASGHAPAPCHSSSHPAASRRWASARANAASARTSDSRAAAGVTSRNATGCPGRQLPEPRQVRRDDDGDDGIAARRLVVHEQEDGQPVRWHLDRARDDAVRRELARRRRGQRRSRRGGCPRGRWRVRPSTCPATRASSASGPRPPACGPGSTRSGALRSRGRARVAGPACAGHDERGSGGPERARPGRDTGAATRSPARSARPSSPPNPAPSAVDREPRTTGTSIPPASAR